jgi:uncharacterized protein
MTDNDLAAGAGFDPIAPQSPRPAFNVFVGPNGVRAGWRLGIALAIYLGVLFVVSFGRHLATQKPSGSRIFNTFTPSGIFWGEFLSFAVYLVTSWLMSVIEGRRFRDYGLGSQSAFGGLFWLGAVAGFAGISVLLVALKFAGVFHLGTLALQGTQAWKYAGAWALAFLTVAFVEETLFRVYFLFTLSSGIYFWPAALVSSLLFGGVHLGNTGESYVGAVAAGGIGFFFCILIRKTGNVWAAIGFHAAWDWGETYFYGVPDSGVVASGHLFSANFSGPVWLTGGSVGPEGSWFCIILIMLLCIAAALLPGQKYPNPDALPDPRRRRAEAASTLFPAPANPS